MNRNARRRASRTNTTGPRGGKRTTHTATKKGARGGMWRVSYQRDSRGRKIRGSEKKVYLGAA